VAAIPAVLTLALFLHYYGDFVSDDAFISFRYAEHLATGRGLEWNPGYRVEGYSNLLWVVLVAALRLAGLSAPDGARALTWVVSLATVVLIVAAAHRARMHLSLPGRGHTGGWRGLVLPALAPLPLALAFPYQYWASLRLETALYAFLLLLAPLLFAEEERGGRIRRWGSAVAYLALALTRPEGAAFIIVPGIYLLARCGSWQRLGAILRQHWLWLAIFVGGMLLYNGWRLVYFGELLPNTYHAKVGGPEVATRGWEYLVRFTFERPFGLVMLAMVLLLGGPALRLVALLMGTILVQAAVVVLEGGDWMREFRLLVPSLPLLAAALGAAVQRAVHTPRGSGTYHLRVVVAMVLLCIGVQGTMGTPKKEWSRAWSGERCDLLLNLEGELVDVSRAVARWLKKHARPNDLVAVNHAGALPYFSDLPALDMAGLNDLHIARVVGPRHGKWDADYVMRRRPAFIVLNTRVAPVNGRYVPGYWRGETAVVEHLDFSRYYVAVPQVWMWRHHTLDLRGYPGHAQSYIMVFRRDERRYQPVGKCLDFESGNYAAWDVVGTAFGKRPATGPRGYQWVEGFRGRYLANSFARSDRATGLLRSRPFTAQGTHLSLLVGGGADAAVGVRLMNRGKAVNTATGRGDGRLRQQVWDLARVRGDQVVLEIYDNSVGPWGHVMADDLCQFVRGGGQVDNLPSQIIVPPRMVSRDSRSSRPYGALRDEAAGIR